MKKALVALVVLACLSFGMLIAFLVITNHTFHSLNIRVEKLENATAVNLISDILKQKAMDCYPSDLVGKTWENIRTGEIKKVYSYAVSFNGKKVFFILDDGDRWEKNLFFGQWRMVDGGDSTYGRAMKFWVELMDLYNIILRDLYKCREIDTMAIIELK
jgi:hypothetical protein